MTPKGPRILALDIETSPSLAYVWGLFQQDVGLSQIVLPTEMLCFAAKFLGERTMHFYSVHHHGKDEMVAKAHELLDACDSVLHFNGRSFDIPHLNREFLLAGLTPPSPFKQIDLYRVVKQNFRFPSNKLAYVSNALSVGSKVKHDGFDLWKRCMAGDDRAWATMRRYNKQDVALLEVLYERLRPWITGHPSHAIHTGERCCPNCGGKDLVIRGHVTTATSRYPKYQCKSCGKYSRSTRRDGGVDIKEAV